MSNLIVVGTFFICLINVIILLAIVSDLQDLRADLYYYSEQKCEGDEDGID